MCYWNSFAEPSIKGSIKGDWVAFATVKGRYVGQSDQLKVHYDKDTLKVDSQFVYVKVWSEGSGVDYIMFSKQYGIWVYQAESNRKALSHRYNRITGRYQESSSKLFNGYIPFKPWQTKLLWGLVTICLMPQYGCVRRLENRMDRWAFFSVDHIWFFVIIFGAIALLATVLQGLSEKTCPDCLNKKVPKQAEVCQKCGYRFSD